MRFEVAAPSVRRVNLLGSPACRTGTLDISFQVIEEQYFRLCSSQPGESS
jgi:hypothetical protein